jgi:Arc/MetJ family transcription regulator
MTMPAKKAFNVIQVVIRWRTDPQLTLDSKRKAVRVAMRRLVREGVCTSLNIFEYERVG